MALHWAGIIGEWKFDDDTATFLAPPRGPEPFGLAQSSLTLRDGKVSVAIKLATTEKDTTASIVLGYRSIGEPYLLVQLGAWDFAYSLARFEPSVGWKQIVGAGLLKNLVVGRDYHVEAEIRGQRLRMRVDGVDVLQTVITAPLVGTSVGLGAWGPSKVEFSRFVVEDKKPSVFVMMPFAEPFDTLYREVIHPVATRAGFEVIRIDEVLAPGIIIDDIQRQIAEAHVVIAEITQPNPNVFYELGYAHALRKPAVLLFRREDKPLPFDVRGYRAIFYDDSIGGKRKVEDALQTHLAAVKRDW
jgi:hypothetical protein